MAKLSNNDRALAAARTAMNEVLANFGDEAAVYLRDAVDMYFGQADVECMDFQDLSRAINDDKYSLDVIAVLADGKCLYVDLDAGKVELR